MKKKTTLQFDGTKLREYLTKPPKEHAKDFGISYGYLRLILTGKKVPATNLAMNICKQLNAPFTEIAMEK